MWAAAPISPEDRRSGRAGVVLAQDLSCLMNWSGWTHRKSGTEHFQGHTTSGP
jgi:hypothetical protein